jgi:hypothetical protein
MRAQRATCGHLSRRRLCMHPLLPSPPAPSSERTVPVPFPADIEKSKQEELTQCTQQAVEAIEALQESIGEVAKSKESWKRFFTAGKFIERMAEVKERPCVWLCV